MVIFKLEDIIFLLILVMLAIFMFMYFLEIGFNKFKTKIKNIFKKEV